jgi:Leucine-rich repeat (LRR) protein
LRDIEGIASLKSLRILVLDNCISIKDFTPVGSLDKLRTLSLNGCIVADLEFCRSKDGLRRLQALTRSRLDDISALSTCSNLRRVELTLGMRSVALSLASSADLEWATLNGIISPDDVMAVSKMTNLRYLSLSNVDWLDSLEYFKGLRNLKSLSVVDCNDLRYAREISSLTEIECLDLSGSDIATTEFAQEMHELREVYLARCRSLRDLAGLAMLPKLEYINLTGGTAPANLELLRQRSPNAHRLVIVEDDYSKLKEYMSFSGYGVS